MKVECKPVLRVRARIGNVHPDTFNQDALLFCVQKLQGILESVEKIVNRLETNSKVDIYSSSYGLDTEEFKLTREEFELIEAFSSLGNLLLAAMGPARLGRQHEFTSASSTTSDFRGLFYAVKCNLVVIEKLGYV